MSVASIWASEGEPKEQQMYWLGTVEMFTAGSCCLPVASLSNERNKPHFFAFPIVPTAQKQRASMTCSGDFKDFGKI